MNQKTKIILVDDHKIFIDGLKSLLSKENSISVIAEAYNGLELVKLTELNAADIVITDIDMPEMNGLDAMKIIKATKPHIKFIILSMHNEFAFMKHAFLNGASAYLPKERSSDELINVLYDVINDAVGKGLVYGEYSQSLKDNAQTEPLVQLTETEKQILLSLAYGKRDKVIADDLNMSIHTVDKYKRVLKEKTGLKSTLSLALYAIKNGYVNINQV